MRLWPLSRRDHPKQILRLFSGTSLLRQSYERVAALLPAERIHVIASQAHLAVVAKELPEVPSANLYGEPESRDTANAIGLAAALLQERDPQAIMGVFTADHVIAPLDRFCEALSKAYAAAEEHPSALVTLGVRPTRPDTNYGYIQRGERAGDGVFKVEEFTEKPSVALATKYLATGNYCWNSGMFTWRVTTILEQIRKHLPQSYPALVEIAAAWPTAERQATLDRLYPGLMRISIDFAVMERADHVLMVEMGCEWVDVGSWPAMETVLQVDVDGNVSSHDRVVHLGSRGNIVVSEEDHLIATIGVDDLVIVHSPDATLICTRRDAQGIKELLDNVRQRFGERYT